MKSFLQPFWLAMLVGFISTLGGCATTPANHALSKEAKSDLKSVSVYLDIPQKEIDAEIVASNSTQAAGGGLLFALIDSAVTASRAEDAKEALLPVKQAISDYKPAQNIEEKINVTIKNAPWLKDVIQDSPQNSNASTLSSYYKETDSNAVLYISSSYALSADFRSLRIYASVYLIPKTESLNKFKENKKPTTDPAAITNAIYRNKFVATEGLAQPTENIEGAAGLWAEDGGKRLRVAMNYAAENLAKQISEDLQKNP